MHNKVPGDRITLLKSRPSVKIQALILFIFAILLYSNTLLHKYALDDLLVITGNQFTRQGVSGIKSILYNDAFKGFFGSTQIDYQGSRYRPLSQIWFAIEYQIFGFNPFISHLTNVILYGLLAVLLFSIMRRLFSGQKEKVWYLSLPLVITALFIAHPLHTEAVANIKGRDEIMCLAGSLGALLFILRYLENRKLMNLFLSGVVFLFALLSKESAFTFLLLIPLTLYFFTSAKFRDYLAALSPVAAAVIVYFSAFWFPVFAGRDNLFSQSSDLLNNPFLNATGFERLMTVFYTWGIYLKLLVFPHPLTHDYYPWHIPIINQIGIKSILPLLIYIGLLIYALIRTKKKSIVAFAVLFYLIAFFPLSNLVVNVGLMMNERFMFVPLLGFCIAISYLIVELRFRNGKKAVYVPAAILFLILTAYSVKTVLRSSDWKDNYSLFTTDIKVSANSAKCNVSAAGVTIEKASLEKDETKKQEMLSKAIVMLNKGLKINPGHVIAWKLLGNAHFHMKNYAQSRSDYETFFLKASNDKEKADALNSLKGLSQFTITRKNYTDGIEICRTYLKYRPEDLIVLEMHAEALENNRMVDSAITLLDYIANKNPQSSSVLSKLGRIRGQYFNDLDKAIEYLLKAHRINPGDPSILENLGVAYGYQQKYDSSIVYLRKASEIRPNFPQTWRNLGSTYTKMGDTKSAEECFRRAEGN